MRPAPFTALRWQRGRMARAARRIAKDAAFIALAGVLLLFIASLGSLS